MPLPKVAIVGRPNVGKSSLFNWLAKRRIAIVEPTPGVTRDRLMTPIALDDDHHVDLIDTGGMGIHDRDNLTADVERQIALALAEADVVLFVVDVRDGVVPLDQHVSEKLRSIHKPVIFVVNKCDTDRLDLEAENFRQLGWEPMVRVSAHQGRGKSELIALILDALPDVEQSLAAPADVELKLAIVGRRNVGKSTFINCLAQAERVIVSEVAGTTRDSVDVRFERDGKTFLAIDTAGVRKKSSVADSIEFYSLARAERSIRRADVVLHFFDAAEPVGQVDKALAGYIIAENKPAIFVVNKWDLARAQKVATETMGNYLRENFSALDYVPIVFVTAKDAKNVFRVLNLAQELHKQATTRVKTARVNQVVREALEHRPPPTRQNRFPRVYFASQIAVSPPTIALVCNDPELFEEWYLRYLTRQLRDTLPFQEVPIKLNLRPRGEGSGLRGGDEEEAEAKPAAKPRPGKPRRPRRPAPEPDVWRDV
jgi:GTP-binding protein